MRVGLRPTVVLFWCVWEVSNAIKIKRTAKDLESQLYEDLLFDYNKVCECTMK